MAETLQTAESSSGEAVCPKSVLRPIQKRLLLYHGACFLLWLLLVEGLACALLLLGDAAFAFGESVRLAAGTGLGVLAAVVFAAHCVSWRSLRARRLARAFEKRFPLLGTTLTNATEFARREFSDPLSEFLRRQAVLLGQEKAGRLSAWKLARTKIQGLCGGIGGVVCLWGFLVLTQGDLLRAVLPRFLDPHGDHPPYSRLKLSCEPEGGSVVFGGSFQVQAHCRGAPVEKLFLLTRDSQGTRRTLMFRRPDGSFSETLSNIREKTLYWVTDGQARTHRFCLNVLFTPVLKLVEVTCRYPAYTKRKSQKKRLTGSEIRVPYGTELVLWALSNRDLSGGTLTLVPLLGGDPQKPPVSLSEETTRAVCCTFTVKQSYAFSLSVESAEGLRCRSPRRGRIVVLPDRPPSLSILSPHRRALATPKAAVPLLLEAADDWGISALLWYRSFNQSREQPVPISGVPAGGKRLKAHAALDLADLGVREGDVIEFFVQAFDNDPRGAKVTTSPIHTVEIIPEEAYRAILQNQRTREELLKKYRRLAQQLRRILQRAQEAKKLAEAAQKAGGRQGEEARRKLAQSLRQLSGGLGAYQAAASALMGAHSELPVEDFFKKKLKQLSEKVKRLRRLTEKLAEKASGEVPPVATLQALLKELQSLAGEVGESIEAPLAHLEAVGRVLVLADRFVALTQKQKEIARFLRRFRAKEELTPLERAELAELRARQQGVGEQLRALLSELRARTEALPQEECYGVLRRSVGEFLKEVEKRQIAEDVAQAAEKLASGKHGEAYRAALRASENMDALVAKQKAMAQQGGNSLCLRFQPALRAALRQSLASLLSSLLSGGGTGGSGGAGYGLFGEDVGLYGPDVPLSGGRGGERSLGAVASSRARGPDRFVLGRDSAEARPRKQRFTLSGDVRFPLRYRTLVGEYFRVVAESQR